MILKVEGDAASDDMFTLFRLFLSFGFVSTK